MREYRGKRVDNGEWAYGNLIKYTDDGFVRFGISDFEQDRTQFDDPGFSHGYQIIEVDSQTVGQWTGKYDKNGKELYKDDVVEEGRRIGFIDWDKDNSRFFIQFKDDSAGLYFNVTKVIGNIHDNPELMEGEDE